MTTTVQTKTVAASVFLQTLNGTDITSVAAQMLMKATSGTAKGISPDVAMLTVPKDGSLVSSVAAQALDSQTAMRAEVTAPAMSVMFSTPNVSEITAVAAQMLMKTAKVSTTVAKTSFVAGSAFLVAQSTAMQYAVGAQMLMKSTSTVDGAKALSPDMQVMTRANDTSLRKSIASTVMMKEAETGAIVKAPDVMVMTRTVTVQPVYNDALEVIGSGFVKANNTAVSLAVIGSIPYNSPDTKVSMAVIAESTVKFNPYTVVTWFTS